MCKVTKVVIRIRTVKLNKKILQKKGFLQLYVPNIEIITS